MKNKITDLNNYLFAQIERLDQEDLTDEELSREINRGKAISEIAAQIISNGNLQLKAIVAAREIGLNVKTNRLLAIMGDGKDGEDT